MCSPKSMVYSSLCLFFALLGSSGGAKILAIMPYFGASHFFVFEPLFQELALRGHHLDVLSYMPRKEPLPNYNDIAITRLFNDSNPTVGFLEIETFGGLISSNSLTNMIGLNFLAREYEKVHQLPQVIALANGSYDLVLIEMFNSDVFYGIAYKTGAPMIGLSSCTALPWSVDSMAAPNDPTYIPSNLGGKSYRMNFIERVLNNLELWICRAIYKLLIGREAQKIAERHLGPLPPLSDIASNTSLLLVHSHFSFLGHRPLTPSIVDVGGLSLKPLKPIAPDVEKVLNNSNGAIYFSMGSVLVGKSMTEEKKQMFIRVLSDTGKTVLWKMEEALNPHPKNIFTKPWFSQRDILQHPKIELFISHCGNLGLTEAVDAGVPVICMPMYGDQHKNARSVEDKGFSINLNYGSLTEKQLKSAIKEILTNKSYREIAKRVQAAFKDRPSSPLDTAIYWIEYVLKHGPITRAPYSDMPIWLREGYDVSAFLLFLSFSIIYLVVKLFRFCFGYKKSKKKEKQN